MKLLHSNPLHPTQSIFCNWSVTPNEIIILCGNSSLQKWNWEGEKLWDVYIEELSEGEEIDSWGLGVGGEFVYVGRENGEVREFGLGDGVLAHVYRGPESSAGIITTAVVSNGSLLMVTGGFDGRIQIWDQASKTRKFVLDGVHTTSIFSFEVKGDVLVSTGDAWIGLWNLLTGELIQQFYVEDVRMYSSVLIGDGFVAAGGSGGLIYVFDRKSSEVVATMKTGARVLNGLILYKPDILLSTDTSGQVSLWSLKDYTRINVVKVHDHSTLTRTIAGDRIFTGGKEGGAPSGACGLDCSLKSCDLKELLEKGKVKPVEHGFPCVALWRAKAEGDRMAVCLLKKGKVHLDIWGLKEES